MLTAQTQQRWRCESFGDDFWPNEYSNVNKARSHSSGVVGEHSVRVEARPEGLVDFTEERMLA